MKLTTIVLFAAISLTGTSAFAWGSGGASSSSSSGGASAYSSSVNELVAGECESSEVMATYGFELNDSDWQTARRSTRHDQYGSRQVGPPSHGPLHTIEQRIGRTAETEGIHYRIQQTRVIFADKVMSCLQTIDVLERN